MIPVRFNFDFSRIVYLQRVSGRELANSREHRLLASDVTEGEILSECALVESRLYARVGKNCLDLRAKNKLFVVINIVERLDPEPVTRDEEAPHSQPDIALHKKAVVIGAAVHDLRIHLRQRVALNAPFLSAIQNPADSAHISRSPFRFWRRHPRRFRNPPTGCAENHSPSTLRYQSTKYAFSR